MVDSPEERSRAAAGPRASVAGADMSAVVEALTRLNSTLKAVEDRLAATSGGGGAGGGPTSPGGPFVPPPPTREVTIVEDTARILDAALALAPTPMTVASVQPAEGSASGGDAVTITGTRFVPGVVVLFGSSAATGVTVVDGTRITATTPPGQGTVDVAVALGDAAVAPRGFSYR